MPLVYPHRELKSIDNISVNNLNKLLILDSKNVHSNDISTEVALKCFEDIKNAQPGFGHYTKKYTVGSLAFVSTVAAPLMIIGTIAYQAVPDSWLGKLGWTLGGMTIGAANRAAGSIIGKKPLSFAFTVAAAALVYGAGKVSDAVLESYSRKEAAFANFSNETHQEIFDNIKETYDDLAEEVINQVRMAASNAVEMSELKLKADKLEALIPSIFKALEELGIRPSEASSILNKLQEALRVVKEAKLEVRVPKSSVDNQYNAQLILELPEKAMKKIALSQDIRNSIEEAKNHQLGIAHTVKGYLASTAAAAATGAATMISSFAAVKLGSFYGYSSAETTIDKLIEQDFTTIDVSEAAVAGALGLGTLGMMGIAGKMMYSKYSKESEQHAANFANSRENAIANLKNIYHGLASHMQEKAKSAHNNAQEMAIVKREAWALFKKLPALENEINSKAVGINTNEVTANLRKTLLEIISSGNKVERASVRFAKK